MEPPAISEPESSTQFSLKGRPGAITLEADGLHHPGSTRKGKLVYTRYSEITHLASSQRVLWLGTRRSVYTLQRRAFVDPQAPEHLVRALLERIAVRAGGSAQLARMTQVEETSRVAGEPRATRILTIACVVVYALQVWFGDNVHAVGHFSPALFADGDWWRLWTANLLHAFSLHLILNLLGLYAIGSLVERAIGSARTTVVMIISGLGAMLTSAWFSHASVVGVSGVVSGLFGALLWLEFRFPAELPAWWRVPRRALFWVTAVTVLLSMLPFVAGAAHAGGFIAGGLVAALQSWTELQSRPSPRPVRAVAAAGVALCVLAGVSATWEVNRDDNYLGRYALRLAPLETISADELNNLAWIIAVGPDSTQEMLETAMELAQRAVEETERRAPHILDTLAELNYRLGDAEAAVRLIEEAIENDPGRDYYKEQRERFLGLREGGPPGGGFFPLDPPAESGPDSAPIPEGGISI